LFNVAPSHYWGNDRVYMDPASGIWMMRIDDFEGVPSASMILALQSRKKYAGLFDRRPQPGEGPHEPYVRLEKESDKTLTEQFATDLKWLMAYEKKRSPMFASVQPLRRHLFPYILSALTVIVAALVWGDMTGEALVGLVKSL